MGEASRSGNGGWLDGEESEGVKKGQQGGGDGSERKREEARGGSELAGLGQKWAVHERNRNGPREIWPKATFVFSFDLIILEIVIIQFSF